MSKINLFFRGIKSFFVLDAFLVRRLSIFINPVYISRRALYKTLNFYSPHIHGKVLDFGCGSKPYKNLFTKSSSYIGVDIINSGHNHRESEIDIYYDGKTLPFPNNHFDCIVSFEVLEHVFNPDVILSELSRVLKPGGFFLFTVPFVWEEHETPYDFARYTSFGIESLARKNNFTVIDSRKTTSQFLTIAQLFIHYFLNNLFDNNKIIRFTFKALLTFPLNFLSIFLDFLIPKNYSLYLDNVFLVRK